MALEIASNQHLIIDQVIQGKASVSDIEVAPPIDYPDFRVLIATLAKPQKHNDCFKLLIRPLNSFKRHILHTDLGSKKQRALDYSAASTYDHRQRHVISPWYAPELSNR